MIQHQWPDAFKALRTEIESAWQVTGSIEVVRPLAGKSGSTVLQVDVECASHKGMAILKLATESEAGEITKHEAAYSEGGRFAVHHLPKLVSKYSSANGLALLFKVAGKSLNQVQPFSRLDHPQQLGAVLLVFRQLLEEWHQPTARSGLVHPSELLVEWLGRKSTPGSRVFELAEDCLAIPSEETAISFLGHWLPNPVAYLQPTPWRKAESIKTLVGKVHGDLHGENLLVRIADESQEPYYLIDFSFYRAAASSFYDHAYFEISYLLSRRGDMHGARWLSLLDAVDSDTAAEGLHVDEAGIVALAKDLRGTAREWIAKRQGDRTDHLTGQFSLARMAAGLDFAGKHLDSDHQRTLAFLYAAVALRGYLRSFGIEWDAKGPVVRGATPVLPPQTECWRGLWEACDQFDSSRAVYVLIAGRDPELSTPLAGVLGRIPWSLVLDLDADSQASGFYAEAGPVLASHRARREMVFDSIQEFNYAAATAWFFASGLTVRPDTIFGDQRSWRRAVIPAIRLLCEQLRDASTPIPVTVLLLRGNIEAGQLTSLIEALDEVLGDQASYVEARARATAIGPDPRFETYLCPTDDLLRGLWLMYGHKGSAEEIALPARALAGDTRTVIALSTTDSNYLAEDLTVVHSGLASTPDAGVPVGPSFWRGGEITWPELDMEADVRRATGRGVTEAILERIDRFQATVMTLEHRPGAGGTTIARRLLWDLRDQYPSVLVHHVGEQTAGRLQHLYHVTRLPLLIVAEAHVLQPPARDALVTTMKSMGVRFAMCYVVRTVRQSSKYAVPEPMDSSEAEQFLSRYSSIAPLERTPRLRDLTHGNEHRRFRTPFFYGLYSFEEEFTHVSDYVREHLADIPASARETVGLLALASRFSQEGLLDSIVLRLLGLSERISFRMVQIFGLSFPRILRVEERYLRIAHPLLATEVLRRIYGENWEVKLADLSCKFIDSIVAAAGANSASALRVFINMFISREFWGEEREERRKKFSELILSIQNAAGQHRVLKKLQIACPSEAHFWNHLGRHHMYIMRSEYHATEACLLKAIELDDKNSIHHHALGMAYRFEIRRRLNAFVRPVDPMDALESIRDLYSRASTEFAKTRDLSPGDEHGFITNIQLICEIIQQLFRISNSRDYAQLLSQPTGVSEWCRAELGLAAELLRRVKDLQPPGEYSERTMTCEARVEGCFGRFEAMINSLTMLLMRSGVYRAPVRRILANAYHGRRRYLWHRASAEDLGNIKRLMEENLNEDLPQERDLLMWLQAARRLPDFDDLEALDRLSGLALRAPSAEVYYYLYMLYFVRFTRGITEDYRSVIDNIDRCKSLNVRTGRPRSHEWLAKEPNWFPILHESAVGEWDYGKNMFVKPEPLAAVEATIKRIKGPQSGTLSLGPLEVFFVPGSEFLPGRDENQRVSLYLGFSYDGMRAWDVSAVQAKKPTI
jgi:hypothetical protein